MTILLTPLTVPILSDWLQAAELQVSYWCFMPSQQVLFSKTTNGSIAVRPDNHTATRTTVKSGNTSQRQAVSENVHASHGFDN